MKNSTSKNSSLILMLGLYIISCNTYSQNAKLTRQERKEAKKTEALATYQKIDSLLQKKNFTIEAFMLDDKSVNSSDNFIKVDSTKFLLQKKGMMTSAHSSFNGWR